MAGAIALRLTGNEQGSYYFLSLHTGKRVVRNNWTVLLMSAEVIATLHQLAAACKKYKGITFTNKDCNIIKDNDDEDDAEGNPMNDTRDNSEITGVDGDDNEDDNDGNNDKDRDDETSQITGHKNRGNTNHDDERNNEGNTRRHKEIQRER